MSRLFKTTFCLVHLKFQPWNHLEWPRVCWSNYFTEMQCTTTYMPNVPTVLRFRITSLQIQWISAFCKYWLLQNILNSCTYNWILGYFQRVLCNFRWLSSEGADRLTIFHSSSNTGQYLCFSAKHRWSVLCIFPREFPRNSGYWKMFTLKWDRSYSTPLR